MDQDRYSILCSDFAARQADLTQWRDNANELVRRFCSEFTSYLGAPNDFTDINGLRRPVVALAKLIEDDGQVILASPDDEPENTATLLLNKDAEWVFAVQPCRWRQGILRDFEPHASANLR